MRCQNTSSLLSLLTAFLLVLFIHACSTAPDPEPIPQTRILEIRMIPDTVAVGDTMLIHCVIEDSLDERFKFFWGKDEGRYLPVNGTLKGPKIKWQAKGFNNLKQGEVESVLRIVRVDNGSEDSVDVSDTFQLHIKNTD